MIGAAARGEVGEAVATEDDALHVRREPLGADDSRGVGLRGPAYRTLCHDGLPKYLAKAYLSYHLPLANTPRLRHFEDFTM